MLKYQPIPDGPDFDQIDLTGEQLAFCNRILSSDALAAILITRVKHSIPTSVIRMSDGERAYMAAADGARLERFQYDDIWLRRYGLTGADPVRVGNDLKWAGEQADFLACTISGVFWPKFVLHTYFPRRAQFIDQFWPHLMNATGRVGALLRSGPSLVLHREHATIVPELAAAHGLVNVFGLPLDSWRDHARLLAELAEHPAKIVLVSGGASGKAFIVRLAQQTGKVVLDVGEAMQGCWVRK